MQDKIFVDVEEYFATCPWMNDFMDETMDKNG
jgi:hypothetical protein